MLVFVLLAPQAYTAYIMKGHPLLGCVVFAQLSTWYHESGTSPRSNCLRPPSAALVRHRLPWPRATSPTPITRRPPHHCQGFIYRPDRPNRRGPVPVYRSGLAGNRSVPVEFKFEFKKLSSTGSYWYTGRLDRFTGRFDRFEFKSKFKIACVTGLPSGLTGLPSGP